ncbi:MAG: hypothetical protein OHK0022_07110 [Roseiflexaceae bacterium]
MQVTLIIDAEPAELPALFDYLAQHGSVTVQWGTDVLPPLHGWEQLPAKAQLTGKERALIQHDLRGDRRSAIAQALELSPQTITVYRRNIRIKLRRVPRHLWLSWIDAWMRRFPGRARPDASPLHEESTPC